jgi:hypothetical protein
MKKIVSFICLLTICFGLLSACVRLRFPPPTLVEINGDIVGVRQLVDIDDENRLDKILEKVELVSPNSDILIAAVFDGTPLNNGISAMIDIKNAADCYVVKNGGGGLDIATPNHPNHPAPIRIKNIADITVIARQEREDFKILRENSAESFSFGQTKLLFFDQTALVERGIVVRQFSRRARTLADIANDASFIYFDDFGIAEANLAEEIFWKSGKIYYENRSVFGVVSGADYLISQAFSDMKSIVDSGERVVVFMVDGLGLNQVRAFGSDFKGIFNEPFKIAASVHPAYTNVALASIITGKDPKRNGITTRGFQTPSVSDIFEYVVSEKQGSTALVYGLVSSVGTPSIIPIDSPITSLNSSPNTDLRVRNNARSALMGGLDLLFVHFKGIDDTNHEFTPLSSEARAKILQIEEYIGQILEGFSGWVIIVSDHGHVEVLEGEVPRGNHGFFMSGDMFTPYWVVDRR